MIPASNDLEDFDLLLLACQRFDRIWSRFRSGESDARRLELSRSLLFLGNTMTKVLADVDKRLERLP
jgi:hypothetical protein